MPINYFIGWIGCIKREQDDLEVKCMWLRDKMQTPETELMIKCRMVGLSERDTLIAKMYYIDRKRPKDIWYWICQHKEYDSIEWDSVHQLLWRIGKKINKISL